MLLTGMEADSAGLTVGDNDVQFVRVLSQKDKTAAAKAAAIELEADEPNESEWAAALAAWEHAESEVAGQQPDTKMPGSARVKQPDLNTPACVKAEQPDAKMPASVKAEQPGTKVNTSVKVQRNVSKDDAVRSQVLRQWTGEEQSYSVWHQERLFDRRCERLAWNVDSSGQQRLAVSSHGGDVIVSSGTAEDWSSWDLLVRGRGKGGAVLDLGFSGAGLYTAGHDGYVCVHDVDMAVPKASLHTSKAFGSTPRPGFCCDHWFTCLSLATDSSRSTGTAVLAGCNEGWLAALDASCQLQWKTKLSKPGLAPLPPPLLLLHVPMRERVPIVVAARVCGPRG